MLLSETRTICPRLLPMLKQAYGKQTNLILLTGNHSIWKKVFSRVTHWEHQDSGMEQWNIQILCSQNWVVGLLTTVQSVSISGYNRRHKAGLVLNSSNREVFFFHKFKWTKCFNVCRNFLIVNDLISGGLLGGKICEQLVCRCGAEVEEMDSMTFVVLRALSDSPDILPSTE